MKIQQSKFSSVRALLIPFSSSVLLGFAALTIHGTFARGSPFQILNVYPKRWMLYTAVGGSAALAVALPILFRQKKPSANKQLTQVANQLQQLTSEQLRSELERARTCCRHLESVSPEENGIKDKNYQKELDQQKTYEKELAAAFDRAAFLEELEVFFQSCEDIKLKKQAFSLGARVKRKGFQGAKDLKRLAQLKAQVKSAPSKPLPATLEELLAEQQSFANTLSELGTEMAPLEDRLRANSKQKNVLKKYLILQQKYEQARRRFDCLSDAIEAKKQALAVSEKLGAVARNDLPLAQDVYNSQFSQ